MKFMDVLATVSVETNNRADYFISENILWVIKVDALMKEFYNG